MAAEPAHGALFLDFDGTLAAIVEDPAEARPLPGVPALLAELAGPFALVAVVSGRPTAFLGEMLGEPAGVTLAGLYGLERALHGPEHALWLAVIDQVVAEARAEAPEGVYVEPKGLTITLHWRHAPERRDWVLAFAERQHARHGLAVHEGRAERELRPPIDVDKGTVVRQLAAEHARQLRSAAVFGDDMGDLPAFAAVGELDRARRSAARRGQGGGRRRREPARGGRTGRPDRAGRRRRGGAAAGARRRSGRGVERSALRGRRRQLVRPPVD